MIPVRKKIRIFFEKFIFWFEIQKCLLVLSKYLENGFYNIRKEGKVLIIEKGRPLFLVFSLHKLSNYSHCKMITTHFEGKYVFHVGDNVYSFYAKKSPWKKYFQNMEEHLDEFSYPFNRVYSLDYKNRMKIEPFIEHSDSFNMTHEEYGVYLLELGVFAKKKLITKSYFPKNSDILKEAVFYTQHGDAYDRNVLFTKNGPVFIDLDDIGLYPAFFDFFRFAITDISILKSFLNGKYNDYFCRVLALNDDSHLEKYKDYYFALFIILFPNIIEEEIIKLFPQNYIFTKTAHLNKKNNMYNNLED